MRYLSSCVIKCTNFIKNMLYFKSISNIRGWAGFKKDKKILDVMT
jgi:hypothetical protein